MELTTDLVLRSKPNGVTTLSAPRAHRHPTPLDWERWAPTIAARYKSEPARVIIGEMRSDGLLVTEKMLRDRLRQWGMNDKNRRSAANERRKALQSANNRSNHKNPSSRHATNCPSTMTKHGNPKNVLHTPKEILVLQRTLKGILDWQMHFEDSLADPNHNWDSSRIFASLIGGMYSCILVTSMNPYSCEKSMPKLRSISAKPQSCVGVICTPPAILQSIGLLSCFASERNSSPWYRETSSFLINAAVEAFPESHPSILLLRLLFSNLTPSQFVMMYEVGSNVVEQCYGEASVFQFRVDMQEAAHRNGLGGTIRSHADTLCTATHEATDAIRLSGLAKVYSLTGQYEESAEAVRRCLAQTEDEGNGHSPAFLKALSSLASLQYAQNDFVGEGITLQKLLTTVLAKDRRETYTSELSINALRAISMLDEFYARRDLDEQRDALQLEFPSAFEL